jgi:hypothetical protein
MAPVKILLLLTILMAAVCVSAQEPVYLVNCGHVLGYTDSAGNYFSGDIDPYEPGGAGYEGGISSAPPKLSYSASWSSHNPDLHFAQRRYMSAYRFDLPAGDYLLRLYWMDGLNHGPHLQLMDVLVEGDLLFDDLDLVAEAGFLMAHEVSRLVSVTDGTLDVEFLNERGFPTLSAIGIWSVAGPGESPDPVEGVDLRPGYGMNILSWRHSWDFTRQDAVIYCSDSSFGPWEQIAVLPCSHNVFYDLDAPTDRNRFYQIVVRDIWGIESETVNCNGVQAIGRNESQLTVFNVTMSSEDYDSLNANPFADIYYPAFWSYDDGRWDAIEARYRGGLSRYFRKKSWKLELDGGLEYQGLSDLLLISNPDDASLLHNHLSQRIFDELLPWNSSVEFIHLEFNGEYLGVYDLAEKVGEKFLLRRGITDPGNLYKAYSDMSVLSNLPQYQIKYEQKCGPDDDHQDLINFIEGVNLTDQYEIGPWLDENLDIANFNDYYSMMIYTRQYDFIVRNYYLYHGRTDGRWSLIPWDMNLCFTHLDLPLNFGTAEESHFWDGSWNRLIDRVLGVPRLRWEYVSRLEELSESVLNRDHLEPLVDDLWNLLEPDGDLDIYKGWYHLSDLYFSNSAGLTLYRMSQRDDHFETMIPAFRLATPVVCINEQMNDGAGSWLELYNFGDRAVDISTLELTEAGVPGSGWNLPLLFLQPGERKIVYLDGDPGQGDDHSPLMPDPAGGTWVLLGSGDQGWDRVKYGAASGTLSQGRRPDGWVNWHSMPPSQNAANSSPGVPTILSVALDPTEPTTADSLFVMVEAASHGDRPMELYFFYHINDSPGDSLQLHEIGGNFWRCGFLPEEAGLMHWWIRAANDLGLQATMPPGAPDYNYETVILDHETPLYINEFMADNETTIQDETGAYEDWLEIYNGGESAIDLAGYTLTDDLTDPDKWTFPTDPASVIPAGGFILVWADEDPGDGPLHATFKLSREGESIGLFDQDGIGMDQIVYSTQLPDTSLGRSPDGGEQWWLMGNPTPGASNIVTAIGEDDQVSGRLDLTVWPNPFNPTLRLGISNPHGGDLRVEIFDLSGRRLRTLVDQYQAAGYRQLTWNGLDNRGAPCASGLYFIRLQAAGEIRTRKALLLK